MARTRHYLSRKMTSPPGGGDIGSEGIQEISDLIHTLAKCFLFFPHVKGIGLSSGFTTRQAVIHQGLASPREGQNAHPFRDYGEHT